MNEEAVLVFLDGQGLSSEVYRNNDLSTLEDLVVEQIAALKVGELDGHEWSKTGTVIYLYGADAELLYSTVKPVLLSYPLCQNSRVIIRRGGPGSLQREVVIPAA